MSDRLPRRPDLLLRKREALDELRQGPMQGRWNSMWGRPGAEQFPTVTILALKMLGWARFNDDKTEVEITPGGLEFLEIMESVDGEG